jgi:hypothetical protein
MRSVVSECGFRSSAMMHAKRSFRVRGTSHALFFATILVNKCVDFVGEELQNFVVPACS